MDNMYSCSVVRKFYDNDNLIIKEEYFVLNGKKEGVFTSYWKNGQIEAICNYNNDKLEGTYISYYNNGQLYLMTKYVNDKQVGDCIEYHQNGDIYKIDKN